ncbi:MAG: hypothetical protein HW421_2797 [Ignavibacteria bacterium]|nr:hypothetical protein [Ignavibacteria bacterium]
MFDIGGGELILIVLAILVLFGPQRIPEFAKMFSKGMQQIRQAQSQFQSHITEIRSDIEKSVDVKEENEIQRKREENRLKAIAEEETSSETESIYPELNHRPDSEILPNIPLKNYEILTIEDESDKPGNNTTIAHDERNNTPHSPISIGE